MKRHIDHILETHRMPAQPAAYDVECEEFTEVIPKTLPRVATPRSRYATPRVSPVQSPVIVNNSPVPEPPPEQESQVIVETTLDGSSSRPRRNPKPIQRLTYPSK
jgi:hypothetical protein